MMADLSGAKWFKSSKSQSGKECVEVAFLVDGSTGVRDSKNPAGPALVFSSADWEAFVSTTATGAFDGA
ncbi:DUF397 domain-containing protein [Nocardia vermiculata]|uniref:DUF397 domain-containing protein n=2 Tax=Nocardia vermiculata TaxID=257274 RepID=A0A846XTX5_9NOCA|nr:DUF397 domain-containing protein [Nocardia vermiculata]NKY50077.1 DUF397 domain-containing protein [Nocardia vermiculata]